MGVDSMTPVGRPPETIDHKALWERIEESEAKTANLLKWVATSIIGIVTAWVLYSANAANAAAEKATNVATTLVELRESQKAITWQMTQLTLYLKEMDIVNAKELTEHEHNPNAHHSSMVFKGRN